MNSISPQAAKPKNNKDLRENFSPDFSEFKNETKEIDIVRDLIKQDQLVKSNSGVIIPDINFYKI